MPKTPLSVTIEEANLLWLKGRAAGGKKRSLSHALDEILSEARRGGCGADASRSVVGTIDIADDDPALDRADAAMRSLFDESLSQPFAVRESSAEYKTSFATPAVSRRQAAARKPAAARKRRRG